MTLSSCSFQLFQFTAAHRRSPIMIPTALKALLVSHYKAELSDFKPYFKLFFQFSCQMDINPDTVSQASPDVLRWLYAIMLRDFFLNNKEANFGKMPFY